MKLCSTALLVLTLCFLACKNKPSEDPKPEPKTYNISFNSLSADQTSGGSTTSAAESIKANAKMLHYYVFNSNDELVYKLIQDSSYTNFGSISHKLAAGTYTSYIVAGQAGLNFNLNEPTSMSYESYSVNWKDTFFKKVQLTVSNADVTQDIKLDRLVGQIQFIIEDAIPVQAKSLVFTIEKDFRRFRPSTGAFEEELSRTFTVNIPANAVGTKNFKVITIIGNTVKPLSLTVRCFGTNQSLIVQRSINNIQCKKNVSTIITGQLFGDPGQGVSVSVDNTWISTPHSTVQF